MKISTKDLFREFKSINKPTLVLYGENDEYCYGQVPKIMEILKTRVADSNNFTFKIMNGCDHGFLGHEETLVEAIAGWLYGHKG